GEPVQVNQTEIGEVVAGKPAATVGLKAGDKVKSVNGVAVEDFIDIAIKIQERPQMDTVLAVDRGGQSLQFHVVPEKDKDRGGVGIIGIRPAAPVEEHKPIGVLSAGKRAVWQCYNISRFTLYYLGQKIISRERPDVAGPVGIAKIIVKSVK